MGIVAYSDGEGVGNVSILVYSDREGVGNVGCLLLLYKVHSIFSIVVWLIVM